MHKRKRCTKNWAFSTFNRNCFPYHSDLVIVFQSPKKIQIAISRVYGFLFFFCWEPWAYGRYQPTLKLFFCSVSSLPNTDFFTISFHSDNSVAFRPTLLAPPNWPISPPNKFLAMPLTQTAIQFTWWKGKVFLLYLQLSLWKLQLLYNRIILYHFLVL